MEWSDWILVKWKFRFNQLLQYVVKHSQLQLVLLILNIILL